MNVKYEIWCCRTDGREFLAFTWTRDAESGCARARQDAKLHSVDVEDVWAVAHRGDVPEMRTRARMRTSAAAEAEVEKIPTALQVS